MSSAHGPTPHGDPIQSGHGHAHGHGSGDDGRVDTARLPPETGRRLVTIGAAIAVVGLLAAGGAFAVDRHRFAFAWLTGFYFATTIGLGGLMFVLIHHLTRAGWSVAARRQMEWVAGFLPVAILLFLPVALLSGELYSWMHPVGEEEIASIAKKAPFLTPGFFFARAALYLGIWSGVSWFFRSNSLKQDASGDVALTHRMQKWSPPMMFGVAYSLGFSAFDWVMSLSPHWFSTIFGVYVFAGSMTSSLAVLALLTVVLQSRGYFQRVSTVEHQHDIGKLLFGFIIFWTYIGFSQYFLIWYANIPEETVWFKSRWDNDFHSWSLLLLLGHFVVPFIWLLSRTAKRSKPILAGAAVFILFMHYVDMYWMVMPNYDPANATGAHYSWIDAAGLLGPLGVLALWLAIRASRDPLYPLRDPRLNETFKNDNGQG